MDEDDNQRVIENSNAANFFNDKASSAAPSTVPHISFSSPQQPPIPPQAVIQPSESRPPPSNRARRHFERESQRLPPLFSQHGPGPSGHTHTLPISPLSLFSPRTGFPGPLLPSLHAGIKDASRNAHTPLTPMPLTPLSPMNYNPVLSSPMDLLHSPMFHVGASSQNIGDENTRGTSPQFSALDPDVYRGYDGRELNGLNSIGFSKQFRLPPPSPGVTEPLESALPLNRGSRSEVVSLGPANVLGDLMGSNAQGSPLFPEIPTSTQHHEHPNHLSSEAFPESPMFHSADQYPLNISGQLQGTQNIVHPATQEMASSVDQGLLQDPNSLASMSVELETSDHLAEESQHDIESPIYPSGFPSSSLPLTQLLGNPPNSMESDGMAILEDRATPGPRSRLIPSSGLRVLPQIIIDRPLVRKAELLQQKVVRSTQFTSFVFNLKESFRMRGDDAVGGTVRRRSDLVKAVTNIEDYGYPASDREDSHLILDATPGLSRENVEYLKNIVLSQLETVKRGAREALYQFSIILVDQLRYRVMRKEDILTLQCSVVDRFVVARNCILEKYTQYVRSRRWIENMSTNQRRGCLTHKQNNILRMWLYRNFRDPYPDDEAKEMMMNETELSLEQVNNWLINARSRFWKPSMDCFDRSSLERKMEMFIRHRMVMSTEEKIKAATSGSVLSDSKRRKKRQLG